jgi:type III secretory pathway component EscR
MTAPELFNKMTLNEEFTNEICHKMEDFILNEIDYSKENGYSSRARRHMKRKLNKELEEFFDHKRNKTNEQNINYEKRCDDIDDSDDSELLIKRNNMTFCLTIVSIGTMISFYIMFGFVIYRYQSCLVPPL